MADGEAQPGGAAGPLIDPGLGEPPGGGGPALSIGGRTISREGLFAAATATADEIAGAGMVAFVAGPTVETAVAVVAGLLAGVPLVPVPPSATPSERAHVLSDSAAELLLDTRADGTPDDGESDLPVVRVDSAEGSSTSYAEPDPGSLALVVYTSGTTGRPKGVMLSRQALAADLDALFRAWEWTAEDVLVHGLPLFHVHGLVLGLIGPLRQGCCLVHTGKPTPSAYAAAAGSLYFGVPTVWSRVCDDAASGRALGGARLLVSGSAPLPTPVFDRMRELTGQAPVERYGMTESLITLSTRAAGERRRASVGTPVAGAEALVVDDAGHEVPYDGSTVGDLLVRGPMLFDGYLGRPQDTEQTWMEDGWFRTGDIAAVDGDGFHRIAGRRSSDLIKVGGHRVGAGEVEDALLCHPTVREAAVVGMPDDDLGQVIVAFVVAGSEDEVSLAAFASGRLARHKCPSRIVFVEALPRNHLGKVRKDLLPAML